MSPLKLGGRLVICVKLCKLLKEIYLVILNIKRLFNIQYILRNLFLKLVEHTQSRAFLLIRLWECFRCPWPTFYQQTYGHFWPKLKVNESLLQLILSELMVRWNIKILDCLSSLEYDSKLISPSPLPLSPTLLPLAWLFRTLSELSPAWRGYWAHNFSYGFTKVVCDGQFN